MVILHQDFITKQIEAGLNDILKAAEYAVEFGDENDKRPDKYFALGEKLLDSQVILHHMYKMINLKH